MRDLVHTFLLQGQGLKHFTLCNICLCSLSPCPRLVGSCKYHVRSPDSPDLAADITLDTALGVTLHSEVVTQIGAFYEVICPNIQPQMV